MKSHSLPRGPFVRIVKAVGILLLSWHAFPHSDSKCNLLLLKIALNSILNGEGKKIHPIFVVKIGVKFALKPI